MKRIWNSYIIKIDSLLERALECCVKNNLRSFISEISPDLESGRVVTKMQLRLEIIEKEVRGYIRNLLYVLIDLINKYRSEISS